MAEPQDPVVEARELLANATPGPWAIWDSCSWRRIGTREPYADGNVICPVTQNDGHPDLLAKREDLELVARAPELLRQLCDEVERLRRRITTMQREAREDAIDAAAEARWQERQGEDYGSY